MDKQEVTQKYAELTDKLGRKATRREFTKLVGISRRFIDKLFGNFNNLKNGKMIKEIIEDKPVMMQGKNLESVLDACGVDREKWEVSEFSTKELANGEFLFTVYFKKKNKLGFDIDKVLSNWMPTVNTFEPNKTKCEKGTTLFCSLNDAHICELTTRDMVFSGKEYNTEIAIKNVKNYLSQIIARIDTRKEGFENGVLFLGGDLLHSTLDEFTRRGTKLHCEFTNEKAFKIVLDLLVEFIGTLSSQFKSFKILSCRGNHESVISTYLVLAAQRFFWNNKNIQFTIFDNWVNHYRIGDIFFILSHGVSDTIKNVGLPSSPLKLKSYIQELLLQHPYAATECKERVVVTAHKHSQLMEDCGSYKFFRFGSTVSADSFGESLGFFNRPQQSCLILDKKEVKELWNFYLD